MAEGEWMMTTSSPPDSSILRFQFPWDTAERYSSCRCKECVCVGGVCVWGESVCVGGECVHVESVCMWRVCTCGECVHVENVCMR